MKSIPKEGYFCSGKSNEIVSLVQGSPPIPPCFGSSHFGSSHFGSSFRLSSMSTLSQPPWRLQNPAHTSSLQTSVRIVAKMADIEGSYKVMGCGDDEKERESERDRHWHNHDYRYYDWRWQRYDRSWRKYGWWKSYKSSRALTTATAMLVMAISRNSCK